MHCGTIPDSALAEGGDVSLAVSWDEVAPEEVASTQFSCCPV